MDPFLRQVVRHYYSNDDISQLCFVFPNRRSLIFFRKYLCEEVAISGKGPLIQPKLFTISDFFYSITSVLPCDQVYQLLVLYSCYKELNTQAESLDDFIFWGSILLSDFNDIDKYLVNPEDLFTNVQDFRNIQDSFDYLNETQLKAIQTFVSHFTSGGKYKDEFLKLWNILLPLYKSFNEKLSDEGYSYEGAVYRALVEKLKKQSITDIINIESKKIIFVGLNALNECEKVLLRKLRNASLAEFCWDYSSEWIKNKDNKSSFFLSSNIEEFPSAFKLDPDGLIIPEINVLSISSSVGQAKQLPQILNKVGAKGIETAIVIPDERLLLPVLNSIPEQIENINVTMGYPLRSSALWTLMNDIASLQLHLRQKEGKYFFYHKQFNAVISNSLIKSIISDEDKSLINKIVGDAQYYISEDNFTSSPFLSLIFKPVVKKIDSTEIIPDIIVYQKEILLYLDKLLSERTDSMALELSFSKEYYLALGRIEAYNLAVLPSTFFKLLSNLLTRVSVPFKGEPLNGLQIMGPLETRALDFENIILLSCNEDVFPARSSNSSFIPPELRKAFGLPTYEYQDAVWAYYFYRMIQRAKKVWLLYDSRSESFKSGEESRYIKQLSMHFGANIKRYVAKADILQGELKVKEIEKTEAIVQKIKKEIKLSASTLNTYLECPAKFYYSKVLGLEANKEVLESLDGSMIGNVFHATMQSLYSHDEVTKDMLNSYLKASEIETKVSEFIMSELKNSEVVGKNLIYRDMICRFVRQTIKRDIELLEEKGKNAFKILGLEEFVKLKINDFQFVGFIDRLDSIEDGVVRIVDYKTGNKDYDFQLGVDDKISLQLFLYDKMVSPRYPSCRFELSIYHTRRLFTEKINSISIPEDFKEAMNIKLVDALNSIADVNTTFMRTDKTTNEEPCKYCDFQTICGR